jgi:urease accessory protein
MDSAIEEKLKLITLVPAVPAWQANLRLGFSADAGTTRLTDRAHVGPLRVQKPLYPEGAKVCHAIIVHPPGGVVGGDELAIDAHVQQAAHVLLTTPGAAKWYKANGKISKQTIKLQLDAQASVEWFPQESIFFDTAHVQLTQSIDLAKDATYIGCDILCFGRSASGETFHAGKISQNSTIRREGKLLWFEQGSVSGGSAAMHGTFGLAGNTVCATLLAVGKALPSSLIDAIRQEADTLMNGVGQFGVTQTKGVIIVRYLGHASEMARALMLMAWRHVRPELLGREAVELRIWNT